MAIQEKWQDHPLLRRRDGREAPVLPIELFFDLVYVFAVTQISHLFIHHLSLTGAVEAAILWMGVWLCWQYTCWVTNWFDPETRAIRLMIFGLMLAGLVMAATIPRAFTDRAWLFAVAYVAIQVGRTLFVLWHLGPNHVLSPNFVRMLGWLLISGGFWIGGASVEHGARMALWAVAALCEYVSPMVGFRLPGLGRSRTSDWTVEGGHIAERCQLFVIVALGETILVNGARFADLPQWSTPLTIAFLVSFVLTLAMWWIYFGTSSRDGSHVITHADDPGRLSAWFHDTHAVMVGGVIVTAVAADQILAQPDARMTMGLIAVLLAGPALYLVANGFYKRVVYACWPPSHMGGLVALGVLALAAPTTDRLMVGGLSLIIMLGVGFWDARVVGPRRPALA
ncbi:MAG: low temperature requirement protein A [bacterium]|nr:low temperature requirement protein A [bacterium]